jgi:hypothetical protein
LHHGHTTVPRPASYPHTRDAETPEGYRLQPRTCVCTVSIASPLSSHTCCSPETHRTAVAPILRASTRFHGSAFSQAAVRWPRKQRSSLRLQKTAVMVMVKVEAAAAAARSGGKQRTSKQGHGAKSKQVKFRFKSKSKSKSKSKWQLRPGVRTARGIVHCACAGEPRPGAPPLICICICVSTRGRDKA